MATDLFLEMAELPATGSLGTGQLDTRDLLVAGVPISISSKYLYLYLELSGSTRKRSLRRLCFYTCLSVILFTAGLGWGASAPVHAGMHTPRTRDRHAPGSSARWEIRATSGRYASYGNAYLLFRSFTLICDSQIYKGTPYVCLLGFCLLAARKS